MAYLPLSDNAARQLIDASTIYEEFARVKDRAHTYAGGMYWKRQGEYEYLVKTTPDNRQQRLGPRSSQTERICQEFVAHKREWETRLNALAAQLNEAERLNKALKVGRVPQTVVSVLQT